MPESAKQPIVSTHVVDGDSVKKSEVAETPSVANGSKTNGAASPLAAGSPLPATADAFPVGGPSQGSQHAGQDAAGRAAEGRTPAVPASGAKKTGAPMKPVTAPVDKPVGATAEESSNLAKAAAQETLPSKPAVAASTLPQTKSSSPAEPGITGSNPALPGTQTDVASKEPSVAVGPEASAPATSSLAVEAPAGTGGGEHPTSAVEGDGPTSAPEHEAAAEPAASTVPHAPAAHEKAGAAGGTIVALMIVSFILEVALLGALGIWAMTMLPFSPVVAVIIAVLPVFVFWALFMSPKANLRLPQPYHAVVAHLLFGAGSGLLAVAGQPVLALCMGILTAISLALTVAVRGQNVESRKKSTGRRAAR